MKATGIVRRIDDLGRVVIPKEIRRTMRIREGDPLEIFTDRDGEVILKKYSPIGEIGEFAQEYADAIYKSTGHIALICDRDAVIAVAGTGKREYMDKTLSQDVERLMMQRLHYVANRENGTLVPLLDQEDDPEIYAAQAVSPIISEGETIGVVVIATKESGIKFGDGEQKVVQTAASFFGKQMEQ
ncbi:stage V sporulation protein T [Eubacteriales bacterium OttesenSCG-928-M02]|nr:stage V sporulation protein T [Eubacteriales bacterium OttesenSCG-928-M02]